MSIRNLKDNSNKPWICECYPDGRSGKRVRKRFATKSEVAAYERFLMKEVDDKPWLGSKPDHRRLSHMVSAMRNPVASTFSAKVYSDYRSKRMAGTLVFVDEARWNRFKPSISTINFELARFKAMFNKLREIGESKLANLSPADSKKRAARGSSIYVSFRLF